MKDFKVGQKEQWFGSSKVEQVFQPQAQWYKGWRRNCYHWKLLLETSVLESVRFFGKRDKMEGTF